MMKEQNGFTLLEVIIAIVIFSIGLLAVASMQMSAIKGNHFSGTLTEATNWAADQMEQLLSKDFTDPELQDTDGDGTNQDGDNDWIDDDGGNFGLDHVADPDSDGQPDNDTTGLQADFQETQGIYTISWNVAEDVASNDTKTVKVTVSWTERGAAKTYEIKARVKDENNLLSPWTTLEVIIPRTYQGRIYDWLDTHPFLKYLIQVLQNIF